ncbi:uncharacterized protein MELLADRAFT_92472 [Melampsora larici-populina 98AG31]|uniref:Uncharacterized protein n=1 Tax=Melampsora larici-populina (strain 98AG31 / pathotype 3-4-7) TaxID=747676 RepID=F4R8K5_MELLP|nr:uncharacterized protein MELLADRAFT_92472 [Melampsora larici-populina 98AG31]EGG11097.1 hypothetical protein MELLADRAFT_92472 [Melampsora larici-populina 98AG31]
MARSEMFDPSAPGVTKQMMLDWLQINHPMSVVSSHTVKSGVAEIVRKKQPEFFPNPMSDAPGLMPDTSNPVSEFQVDMPVSTVYPSSSDSPHLAITPEEPVNQRDFPTSSVPLKASVTQLGPPISSAKPLKRATFALPVNLPQELLRSSTSSEGQLKRPGSPTPNGQVSKRANLDNVGLSQSRSKPVKKEKKRVAKSYPVLGSSKPSHQIPHKSTTGLYDSCTDLLDTVNKEDLKALRSYEVEHMKSSSTSTGIQSSSKMMESNGLINTPDTPEMRDLIDLSGVDWLGVEDLAAITEDKQKHRITASTIKSGVDVFHEERRRAEIAVSGLQDSVSQLLKRMDAVEQTSVASIIQNERQRYEQDRALEEATRRLDNQAKCIDDLKDTVSGLKEQLHLLQRQCDKYEQDIQTQERCIVRLMQHDVGEADSDGGEEDSDGEVGNNEPGVDSQSDYSV